MPLSIRIDGLEEIVAQVLKGLTKSFTDQVDAPAVSQNSPIVSQNSPIVSQNSPIVSTATPADSGEPAAKRGRGRPPKVKDEPNVLEQLERDLDALTQEAAPPTAAPPKKISHDELTAFAMKLAREGKGEIMRAALKEMGIAKASEMKTGEEFARFIALCKR